MAVWEKDLTVGGCSVLTAVSVPPRRPPPTVHACTHARHTRAHAQERVGQKTPPARYNVPTPGVDDHIVIGGGGGVQCFLLLLLASVSGLVSDPSSSLPM